MDKIDLRGRLDKFRSALLALSAEDIVRRFIVFGDCAVVDPDEYFSLRSIVAKEFHLHPNDVLVVGSGKLGFSIAPQKRYRPFGDSSDLDVVIISDRFFDLVWSDVHRYSEQGGWWEGEAKFKEYLFRGWIRPDMLPPDQNFQFGRSWWEFFNKISASRDYSVSRIRGAIYKNWRFLESYQQIAVTGCLREIPEAQEAII